MSNDLLQQFSFTYDKKTVNIYGNISIGSTGAPTLNNSGTSTSKGIKSITRTGVGAYTVVLKSPFYKLLNVDATIATSTGIATSPTIGIISGTTNVSSSTSPQVSFQFSTGGTATELGSGSVMYLQITTGDSSAY